MDNHKTLVVEKMMERTAKALNSNGYDAHVVRSRAELMEKVGAVLRPGDSCACGGSETLRELGLLEHFQNGGFTFLDRMAEGVDRREVQRQAFSCDVYFASANAITEHGELYNIDGRGNRVAAMIYGPDKVVVIAGYNKIVPDLDAARARKQLIAGPANAIRLGKEDIPCYHTGRCSDCSSPGRFCSYEVVFHRQMVPGRITVLLVNEELGY